MATSYGTVINTFLGKVSDYKLLSLLEEDAEEELIGYMKSACAIFKQCKEDLKNRDDNLKEFSADLSEMVIDIITETMIVQWLKSQLYNTELLESRLNTKDFTEYSPAKLILEMRNLYESALSNARRMRIEYTYDYDEVAKH